MIVNLQATSYDTEKKGDVKRLRRAGKIPAILYGHKEKSRRIYIENRDFRKVLDVLKDEAVTVNLTVNKKDYLCVIKAVQHNPVTDELLHVDFQHIHKKEKIRATIPIHLVGEAPGIKKGGILDQHLHEVVVKCLPSDIPSHIDVDISKLDLGDTIHLYDVDVSATEFEITTETPVVSVLVPRAVVAEAKPEVEEEAVVEGEKKEEEVTEEEAKEKEGEEKKPEEPPKKG